MAWRGCNVRLAARIASGMLAFTKPACIVLAGLALAAITLTSLDPAWGQDGGRLLATSGVSQMEGAGGGGLVPWALITGYGSRDSVGANLHDSFVYLPDFSLETLGGAIGIHDRVELSYAHEWFDTRQAGGRLGLGDGYQLHLDVVGAKLRLVGKAVYDQDGWLPQIAIGAQFKSSDRSSLLQAIGARSSTGLDLYASATRLFLAQSLLLDMTLRATRANQFGLLGFGGDRHDGYSLEPEASAALLLTRRVAIGAEARAKPDNLSFARETAAYDAFIAWFIDRHVSATLAWADLGTIARQQTQNGVYISLQAGF